MKLLQLSPYIEELCITYGNELEDVEMNFEKEDMALQLLFFFLPSITSTIQSSAPRPYFHLSLSPRNNPLISKEFENQNTEAQRKTWQSSPVPKSIK